MNFNNHIINRFLSDKDFQSDIIVGLAESKGIKPDEMSDDLLDGFAASFELVKSDGNKTYFVTKSVLDKLHLFDTKKCMDIEGWKIFASLPTFKKTFVLQGDDNKQVVLRVSKNDSSIGFCYLVYTPYPRGHEKTIYDGNTLYTFLYFNFAENTLAEHFYSDMGRQVAPFIYALLCYVELCDNEEVIVEPKKKYGTKKTGNFINTLSIPIIVINNTWNITTIRTEGFPVSGHPAIRYTGVGRNIPKLVYIAPFNKKGYKRKSGKQLSESNL